MDRINIYPLSQVDKYLNQNMNMFLTHLVEKNRMYREIARRCDGYKILDNSIIELGSAVDVGRVAEAAAFIGADEIILPDAYKDCDGTLKMVENALNWLDRHGCRNVFKVMAVAHGATEEDWSHCFQRLENIAEIDVIGIPKVLATMHPAGRPHFEQYWYNTSKTIHLLGLWYSFSELLEYQRPNEIRSVDTCLQAYLDKFGLGYYGVRPNGYHFNLEDE